MKIFLDGFNRSEQYPSQNYGEMLRNRRKEYGITLMELSQKTGISDEKIAKAELGLVSLAEQQKIRIEAFIFEQEGSLHE